MLILGIETATERVSVAIGSHIGVVGIFEVTRGRRHAETVVPAIEFVCRQSDVLLNEISVIAVDVGPGLFTGMRVGLASAKAMAHALHIPMIGISSLELLAHALPATDRVIAAVVDARKGEIFYALFRSVTGGVLRLSEPTVGKVSDLLADVAERGQQAICVGDGAWRYQDEIAQDTRIEIAEQIFSYPSASALVHIAHVLALGEKWVNPWQIEPMYLRPPDAEINWTTRHAGASS